MRYGKLQTTKSDKFFQVEQKIFGEEEYKQIQSDFSSIFFESYSVSHKKTEAEGQILSRCIHNKIHDRDQWWPVRKLQPVSQEHCSQSGHVMQFRAFVVSQEICNQSKCSQPVRKFAAFQEFCSQPGHIRQVRTFAAIQSRLLSPVETFVVGQSSQRKRKILIKNKFFLQSKTR